MRSGQNSLKISEPIPLMKTLMRPLSDRSISMDSTIKNFIVRLGKKISYSPGRSWWCLCEKI